MNAATSAPLAFRAVFRCALGALLCGMLVATPQTLRWFTGSVAFAKAAAMPVPVEEEEVKHADASVVWAMIPPRADAGQRQRLVADDDRPTSCMRQVAVPPPKAA